MAVHATLPRDRLARGLSMKDALNPRRIPAALLACAATTTLALAATSLPASAAPQVNLSNPLTNAGSNKCSQPMEPSGHIQWAGDRN